MNIHESAEDYLEKILMLQEQKGSVRSIDIAVAMGFSKPSVSVAMKNLRENGYISMDPDGFIKLEQPGMEIAQRIYARHLGGLEGDINQILANGTGQHPLEEGKILVPLVFRHNAGALAELRNDLLVVIDKAAIDFRNIAAISAQMAANLADFLIVHGVTSFLYEMPPYYSTGVRKNPEENRRGRAPPIGSLLFR